MVRKKVYTPIPEEVSEALNEKYALESNDPVEEIIADHIAESAELASEDVEDWPLGTDIGNTKQPAKGAGLRFNTGKIRYDLLPPIAMEGLAKVLTYGANKYTVKDANGLIVVSGANNWKSGMPWSTVLASMKRHISAIEKGEDFDEESTLKHIDHVLCNAAFLSEYYKIYPQGDDRYSVAWNNTQRIALDVDGVLADFSGAFKAKAAALNITWPEQEEQLHWNFPYNSNPVWSEIMEDKQFFLDMKPLCDPHLPFEPVAYVTARQIPSEWTQEWLQIHGFPCEPVLSVGVKCKSEALRSVNAEIFVDDNWDNFVNLNKQGICAYLFDQPYNRKYNVGYRRIKDLTELI